MFWSLALACVLVGQAEDAKANESPKGKAAQASDRAAAEREAARKKLDEEVGRLINRYVRGDLTQKQQIIQELLDKGPDVLDVLPPIDDGASADRKQLLTAVRPKLEKQLSESTAKASTVTLKGAMPLSQALAALEQQSGNHIAYQPEGDAKEPDVKVDLVKVPFWQSLDTVLDGSGLTINLNGDRAGALSLMSRPQGEVPQRDRRMTYSGPFRIEATKLETRRDQRTKEGQMMRLALEVDWEPRLAPINLRIPMASVKAVDEQGHPLTVSGEGSSESNVTSGSVGQELALPLALPSRDVKKIASLKGTMDVLLPGRTATFKFEKIKQGDPELKTPLAAQRQYGVQVVLHRIVKNDKVWQVGIVLRFDNAQGALASHLGWYTANETYLLDAKGERTANDGYNLYRRAENEVGLLYDYDLPNGPDGLTLVYKTPSLIMNVPVPFEIKDIELP